MRLANFKDVLSVHEDATLLTLRKEAVRQIQSLLCLASMFRSGHTGSGALDSF